MNFSSFLIKKKKEGNIESFFMITNKFSKKMEKKMREERKKIYKNQSNWEKKGPKEPTT